MRAAARQGELAVFIEANPPRTSSLDKLRNAAKSCQACPLYRNATQTVFGEGRRSARIVLIGEQPGDQEDRDGRPFVGPAGRVLDQALVAAGIDRSECYVTNAVKHFKWEPRGKRRLHKKPNSREIAACRPWWQAEVRALKPDFVVCLGSTAAQAVIGRMVKINAERGRFFDTEWAKQGLVTIHPSALLRVPDPEDRKREFARLVDDLTLLKKG
jgi:uracil-DNA glycosylase